MATICVSGAGAAREIERTHRTIATDSICGGRAVYGLISTHTTRSITHVLRHAITIGITGTLSTCAIRGPRATLCFIVICSTLWGTGESLDSVTIVLVQTIFTYPIGGGSAGSIYKIYNSITTSGGSIERRYFRLRVKERSL